MKKERDAAIELYRCLMMFGIVFIHSAYCSIGAFTWENAIGRWCVDGFVLISGFCAIRSFSIIKVLKLYSTMVALIITTDLIAYYVCSSPLKLGWKTIFEGIHGAWFVHAYVIVMVLAPIINAAAENDNRRKLLLPFSLLILFWGIIGELPILGKFVWKTSGVQSFSGFTLAAVYAIGRLYRLEQWDKRIKVTWVFVLLPILLSVICIGFHNKDGVWVQGWLGNYASPISVLVAILVFSLFRRIKLSRRIGGFVVLVSGSMFPVYVIHGRPAIWGWMRTTIEYYLGRCPTPLLLLIVSIIVFTISIIFDVPRRVFVTGYVCLRNRLYKRVNPNA